MKKSPKVYALGVTLLEIMLVLAIAAMVIVMSIRYYQSASNNQKIAAGLNAVTSIIAAGESVLGATGSLTNITAPASQGGAAAYLPNGQLPNSPWGTRMTIPNAGATNYTISMNIPTAVCNAFKTLVEQNSKITGACGANTITITVNE